MFREKTAVAKDTPIKGVRMGAGDRSYLVRDNQIDVLKNMYGGVQVSTFIHPPSSCAQRSLTLAHLAKGARTGVACACDIGASVK